MNCSYSLIVRNQTPIIDPGKSVEVELYLSGYGTPQRNKLVIQWSLSQVIDKGNPGFIKDNIKLATKNDTGEIKVATGTPYSKTHKIDETGVTLCLNQGFFFDNPRHTQTPANGLKGIISESKWDNESPLLIRINTLSTAPSGDYDVTFVFTYADNHEVNQAFDSVQFHITSWWEHHQSSLTITGIIVAVLALLATAIGAIWQIFHWG